MGLPVVRVHLSPYETQVRVLGGLPLYAQYTLAYSSFQPHTGRPGHDVEDVTLHDARGRRAKWAERRMSDADWNDVVTQIYEGM